MQTGGSRQTHRGSKPRIRLHRLDLDLDPDSTQNLCAMSGSDKETMCCVRIQQGNYVLCLDLVSTEKKGMNQHEIYNCVRSTFKENMDPDPK